MKKFAFGIVGLAAPLLALMVGPVQAGPLTNTQIFSQFNAVVFGTFASSSDVEGRTVVGGDLVGGATFNLNPVGATASSYSALTVYGNATSGRTYNVNNNGGVTIAGNSNVSFNGISSAYVGGTNSGALSVTSGSGNVTVVGANSGTVSLSSGGSVYLGSNSATVSASGAVALSINGNTSSNVSLNGGGNVLLNGSNNGTISLNGGTVSYTGSKGNMNLNSGATATLVPSLTLTAPPSTLSSFASVFQNQLTTLSTQLNAVAQNSTVTLGDNTISFNAAPVSGVAIFDINTSLFTQNASVRINLNGATSVIINVDVDSCISSACAFSLPGGVNFANPTGYASTVLWNFVNATSLTFNTEFGGSVLAPLATVTNNSPIDGTLVSASYSGNGELHSHPYTGIFPGTATPAPEPASLALVGTGLLSLAAVRRRKSSALNPQKGRRPF